MATPITANTWTQLYTDIESGTFQPAVAIKVTMANPVTPPTGGAKGITVGGGEKMHFVGDGEALYAYATSDTYVNKDNE